MNIKASKGKNAELMVAGFLRKNGCIIAKMNYHSRYGEIDIIAEDEKNVIFVEVKMRSKGAIMSPAEAVDVHKQRKIILTAQDFLVKSNLSDLQPRFDVAEVYEDVNKVGDNIYRIRYIKNAFQVS